MGEDSFTLGGAKYLSQDTQTPSHDPRFNVGQCTASLRLACCWTRLPKSRAGVTEPTLERRRVRLQREQSLTAQQDLRSVWSSHDLAQGLGQKLGSCEVLL